MAIGKNSGSKGLNGKYNRLDKEAIDTLFNEGDNTWIVQYDQSVNKKGKSGERFAVYKKAKSLNEFFDLGGSNADLRFDLERGLCELKPNK